MTAYTYVCNPKSVITVDNVETGEFFFSTEHSDQGLGDKWVPVTHYLPQEVKPRPGFESGIIKDREDLREFNELCGEKEIPNPDPNKQA